MTDYQIDENTHRLLLSVCGLPEHDGRGELTPVPEAVAKQYSEFNRCFRRGSGTVVSLEALAFIAALNGYGATVSFLDGGTWDAVEEWNAKRLKYDTLVNVLGHDGKERPARIKRLTGRGSAVVVFEGSSNEVKIRAKDIQPPREPAKV